MSADELLQAMANQLSECNRYDDEATGVDAAVTMMNALDDAAALLDGPLRETLRLARIGAALEPVLDDLVTCVNYMPLLPTRRHAEATERAHLVLDEVFAERMLAAGAPVESSQGDAS